MKKILFLLVPLLFILSGSLTLAQDRASTCSDYCSADTLYSRGTYDERAGSCSYSSRSFCDYGCNGSFDGCAVEPVREVVEEPVEGPVERPVEEPYVDDTVYDTVEPDLYDYEYHYEDTNEDSRDTDSTNTTAREDDYTAPRDTTYDYPVEDEADSRDTVTDDSRDVVDEADSRDITDDSRDVVDEESSSILEEYFGWLNRNRDTEEDEDILFSQPLSEEDDSSPREEDEDTERDSHNEDEEDREDEERADDPVIVVPPTNSGEKRATYTTEDGEGEVELSFAFVNLLIDTDNIVVETEAGIIVTPNKLDSIINNRRNSGEDIKDIEIVLKDDANGDGEDDIVIIVTSEVPVKVFFIFNANLRTVTEIAAADLTITSVKTPWWSIFTKLGLVKIDVSIFHCEDWKECQTFDDKNMCTGLYYCDESTNRCKIEEETIMTCKYANEQCKVGICKPTSSSSNSASCDQVDLPNGTTCDDGYWWTEGDSCQTGVCVGGKTTTECVVNADCEKLEDGNLCTGSLYCDAETKTCIVNPATKVICYQDNELCTSNTCNPNTGQCSNVNEPSSLLCDDGNKFTEGDTCSAGVCKSGKFIGECQKQSDCDAYEDDNLCNGTMYCNLATSKCMVNAATKVYCKTVGDTACSKNACNKKTGLCAKESKANGYPCDDGDIFTKGDICSVGICKSGKFVGECYNDSDCSAYEDGNLCNGTMYCELATAKCVLNPATVISCQSVDNTQCSIKTCNPTNGQCEMVSEPNFQECTDYDKWTEGDSCQSGSCVSGEFKGECKVDSDCPTLKGPGNLCRGDQYCDKTEAKCKENPATTVICYTPGEVCNNDTGLCAVPN